MVDALRILVYTGDARPYPAFPYASSVWADGGNWELGHWLTERVGGGALTSRVSELETKAVRAVDAGERVISLETEMREVRRILQRIEAKLDERASKASLASPSARPF